MLLLAPKALDENGANVPLDPQTPKRQALASGSTCLSFRFGVNELQTKKWRPVWSPRHGTPVAHRVGMRMATSRVARA